MALVLHCQKELNCDILELQGHERRGCEAEGEREVPGVTPV